MRVLRLLADDLTGALDSAAAFGTVDAPVSVRWSGEVPAEGAVAFDSGTRECGAEEARARVGPLAAALWGGGHGIAFKKVDSLLRGNEAAEIAEIAARVGPQRIVIAPAFPAQGRVTRGGRQHVVSSDGVVPVALDLAAALGELGLTVNPARPGDAVPAGISLWDAETDRDLDRIVEGLPDGALLVGTGGLAAALARRYSGADPSPQGRAESTRSVEPGWGVPGRGCTPPRSAGADSPSPEGEGSSRRDRPAHPLLLLIGSHHPVMLDQLTRISPRHALASDDEAGRVQALLDAHGVAAVSVAIPDGVPRPEAAALIDRRLAALALALPRPGTLFVSGGETLRGLCEALGAGQLDVIGEILPGVPRSVMRGGRWDGLAVISKSGAFGAPDLLQRLADPGRDTSAGVAA